MPELPEVETICRQLQKQVLNQEIVEVIISDKNLRYSYPPDLKLRLTEKSISSIQRRAKYLKILMNDNQILLMHLGMSGRITIKDASSLDQKHDHFVLYFKNKTKLVFNDPRRFGFIDLFYANDNIKFSKYFGKLGPEPLEAEFTSSYLIRKLKSKDIAIKKAIMDNHIIVGVGNIYASESLFLAKIHPLKPSCNLTSAEIHKLVIAIQRVLKQAIEAGGSSLRDYVTIDGTPGYFQLQSNVYGRQGQSCKKCRHNIEKIIIAGRATFLCHYCQKLSH